MKTDDRRSEVSYRLLRSELSELLAEPEESARHRSATAFDEQLSLCGGSLIIFGCGNMGGRVLHCLRQHGIEPLAATDSNARIWGNTFFGLPIFSPEEAITKYGQQAGFLITIYNPSQSVSAIIRGLRAYGCPWIFPLVPMRWKFHREFLPFLRDDLPHKVLLAKERVLKCYEILEDDASRREYLAQVRWRLLADYDKLEEPETENEYFPEDLFQLDPNCFFIDVGAYDGDTVAEFLRRCSGNFRKILAIEPDPGSFTLLTKYIQQLPSTVRNRITALPYAVGAYLRHVRFAAGQGLNSSIDSSSNILVASYPLDQIALAESPSYIKVDAEGAEIDILMGCQNIVTACRPILAICAYHTQDHLWEVPLKLNEICENYSLFIRAHRTDCWDTVCYAIPHLG